MLQSAKTKAALTQETAWCSVTQWHSSIVIGFRFRVQQMLQWRRLITKTLIIAHGSNTAW